MTEGDGGRQPGAHSDDYPSPARGASVRPDPTSLRHLIDLVADLEHRGIGLRSLTESIDTSTPGGKLVFHVFAALAEFERDLIRERTQAGLAAARARGRVGGRPTVWTPDKVKVARALYDAGERDISSIARATGVSRASVYRLLRSRNAESIRP